MASDESGKAARSLLDSLRSWRRVGRWWPGGSPFEIAVGAVLTQQSSWTNVERSLLNLRQAGLLEPSEMMSADLSMLTETIRPSGFPGRKAETLRSICQYFVSGGGTASPSPSRDDLLSIRGIGDETADAVLLYCFGEPRFVVDAYALRLFSRLPIPHDGPPSLRTSVPMAIPDPPGLMELHGLIVELCKEHCRTAPRCNACPLRERCETGKACINQ